LPWVTPSSHFLLLYPAFVYLGFASPPCFPTDKHTRVFTLTGDISEINKSGEIGKVYGPGQCVGEEVLQEVVPCKVSNTLTSLLNFPQTKKIKNKNKKILNS
jgi:hypothetical protein